MVNFGSPCTLVKVKVMAKNNDLHNFLDTATLSLLELGKQLQHGTELRVPHVILHATQVIII